MSELKTLKDLPIIIPPFSKGDMSSISIKVIDLRQEAIKWIEYYMKKREVEYALRNSYETYKCECNIEFIKRFFNITDEDLK